MTNFIKEQQEEARNKMAQQPQRDIDGFAYIRTDNITEELDSIISQVVQNTVEEIERRVEEERYFITTKAHEQYNQALTDVQSLLKDITTGV